MEGGIYISPEFQLGQVYDGAADVVEDVILYRPVYVCAPRPTGSDIGNGHSPIVRGVDHTPSPSSVAGSPSAAVRPRAGGVSPAGSVEHVNAYSSPSHGRSAATRTTKKVESTTTTTTTTVDGRSNEHHHQHHHHHHHHHTPHQQQKEELSEPLQHGRTSHEVIVHGTASSESGGRDTDSTKPTVTAAVSEKAVIHDDIRLMDSTVTSSAASTIHEAVASEPPDRGVRDGELDGRAELKHIGNTTTTAASTQPSITDTTVLKDHVAPSSSSATSPSNCNSTTNVATQDHCDVATAERDSANTVCQPTPTN